MSQHLGWLVIVLPFLAMLLVNALAWPHLGDRIPIHWNWKGEADGWGGKGTIWLLPGLFLWTTLFLALVTMKLPGPNEDANRKSVRWVQAGIAALFLFLQGSVLTLSLQNQPSLALAYFNWGFGIFMLALGMSFKTCKRNNVVGMRSKWSLASDENWDRTHRFAGSAFNLAGIGIAGMGAYLPPLATAGFFLFAVLATFLYSYWQRKADPSP